MSTWTEHEVDILVRHYTTKTRNELTALLPGKTEAAIRGKVERLCLTKARGLDYTGHRLGSLIFIKRLSTKHKSGVVWRAKCDCGNEIDVVPARVKRHAHPSCGCMRPVKFSKNPQERTLENRLRMYRQRAERDSIVWSLTDDEFFRIIRQDCSYCGQPPDNLINAYRSSRHKQVRSKNARQKHKEGAVKVNGIDRIDSTKGYTTNNCVPCCQYCNYAKRKRSHDDFMRWIQQLIKHHERMQRT